MSRERSPVFVLLLAALIVVPHAARAAAMREPAAPAITFPTCLTAAVQSVATDTVALAVGSAIAQPLPALGNLASVGTGAYSIYYSNARLTLHEWDPATLLPDAQAIALRSVALGPSQMQYGSRTLTMVPPYVAQAMDHVADPPRSTLAWVWTNLENIFYMGPQACPYDTAGPAEWPAAISWSVPPSTLPGPHPVAVQTICLGDASLQALRLTQAIDHHDSSYDLTWDSFMLRFRVPQNCRLRWIELPLDVASGSGPWPPGTVGMFDAQGRGVPPATMGEAMVHADFATGARTSPAWVTHVDFDAVVTLLAQHDYWLWVRTRHAAPIRVRTRTGSEGPDFAAGIGELWARQDSSGAWTLQPSRTIGFRLIGEPLGTTTAPAPALALAFSIMPNPVRDEALVQWSAASGALRVDVLDVRGRRVGGAALEAQGAGTWRWRPVDARGAPLPAGVYFVRATDGVGRAGMRRVVLVR